MKKILAIAAVITITYAENVFAGYAECVNQCTLTRDACITNCKSTYKTQMEAIKAERAACLANATTADQKKECNNVFKEKKEAASTQAKSCIDNCK